jgi:cell division protein FtsL
MARAATAAARPKTAPARATPTKTTRTAAAPAGATRTKKARAAAAPARSKSGRTPASARHTARRRSPASRRATAAQRRASGGGQAVALPVRVLNTPFARAARRGTSGMLDALLSGRGWIALVFVLLAGIVFFNVDLLQMNREIAGNDQKISALKREIARNRLDVARLASSERIQESAAQLGLVLPAPGDVRYLKARPRLDSHQAAKRITAPNTAYVSPEPIDTTPEPVAPTATDPAATDPTASDPAAAPTTTTDPATADPAATEPTAAPAPTTTSTPAG